MDGTVALLRKWLQEMPTTRRVVDEASAGSRGSGGGALPELHAPLMNALALGCPAVLFLSADELRSRAAMLSRLARLPAPTKATLSTQSTQVCQAQAAAASTFMRQVCAGARLYYKSASNLHGTQSTQDSQYMFVT